MVVTSLPPELGRGLTEACVSAERPELSRDGLLRYPGLGLLVCSWLRVLI